MISDDPDEDADSIDDESILGGCIEASATTSSASRFASQATEWPSAPAVDKRLAVDPVTMDRFRRESGNCAARMNLILKSWISTQSRSAV